MKKYLAVLAVGGVAAFGLAGQAEAATTNPDGTITCGTYSGWRVEVGATTSCRFGRNTKTAAIRWLQRHDHDESVRFRVRVFSPATRRSYTMRCQTWLAASHGQILCSGGNRAMVNLGA